MQKIGSFLSIFVGLFVTRVALVAAGLISDDPSPGLPSVGSWQLRVVSPTVVELTLINTKGPDPATVSVWNWVNASHQFTAPPLSNLVVTVAGQTAVVQAVGFKRRPLYAPLKLRDLRIDNRLYLQLASPIAEGQTVRVVNPDGTLWPSNMVFAAAADPQRWSPAIHVNQEGYVPEFPKQALVGYYLGSLGELAIPAGNGFAVVDTASGVVVYQGALVARPDVGYNYTPRPYQQVYEADFSAVRAPGEYRLVVPRLGASWPFRVEEGVAMAFARAYALGLYHQRCGTNNALPFTRFTHGACHLAAASVPLPAASFGFTWNTISNYALIRNPDNPVQTAPRLTGAGAQQYPFVNTGTVEVSGGHHDAGDYSKYTINSASLIHYLVFAVDALPGVAQLDNLGIPESGDGVSDVLEEAKWEADFLVKLQDADGGFYFLVYPRNREYEQDVLPDHGDPQVVWPKNTAVTAAAVAALAQCGSSPWMKRSYPAAASNYVAKAELGWLFLTNAIGRYGKAGAYQKITHYGDDFTHDDELAWAACELYLATGDPAYQQQLLAWFDPADPGTRKWGWWHLCQGYGCAIRSYAFGARSGRLKPNQLDPVFLERCESELIAGADAQLRAAQQCAYGTSFPEASKRVRTAGWYFSTEQAFDLAVACQLDYPVLNDPRSKYLAAILSNLNYEAGGNPVNVSYVTGLGWKRQREIVSQYAQNDRRVLPPSGLPISNLQGGFGWLDQYRQELGALTFPPDGAPEAPYPLYDRWGDSFNVSTECVILNQARSLATVAFLAARTALRDQPWRCAHAQIVGLPTQARVRSPVTVRLRAAGMDLRGARIVWEARDQEPAYGAAHTFSPVNPGQQWVEAEVQWPDGRRVFAATNFPAASPIPRFPTANAR
ncbi:MAG: glycoside hydrolase family 9 protein [Limisphaerales bacterium]